VGLQIRGKKYRSRLDLVYDILECVKLGNSKTAIMYKANLSYLQMKKYVQFLLERELIEKISRQNGNDIYIITEKGRNVVNAYKTIYQLTKLTEDIIRKT